MMILCIRSVDTFTRPVFGVTAPEGENHCHREAYKCRSQPLVSLELDIEQNRLS